jgi:hypothetical protein
VIVNMHGRTTIKTNKKVAPHVQVFIFAVFYPYRPWHLDRWHAIIYFVYDEQFSSCVCVT